MPPPPIKPRCSADTSGCGLIQPDRVCDIKTRHHWPFGLLLLWSTKWLMPPFTAIRKSSWKQQQNSNLSTCWPQTWQTANKPTKNIAQSILDSYCFSKRFLSSSDKAIQFDLNKNNHVASGKEQNYGKWAQMGCSFRASEIRYPGGNIPVSVGTGCLNSDRLSVW